MIALSNCSLSWSESKNTSYISSTGDVKQVNNEGDSLVLVPIEDLKLANMKMTELKYEKEINLNLRNIIRNDSCIISDYEKLNVQNKKTIKKVKTQRNVVGGVAIIFLILAIF